jgi:hypothetical protein
VSESKQRVRLVAAELAERWYSRPWWMAKAVVARIRWAMAGEIDDAIQTAVFRERLRAQAALCTHCAGSDHPHLLAGDWVHGPKGMTVTEVASLAHSDRSAALIHPCGAVALMKLWCDDVVRARELDAQQLKKFKEDWQDLSRGPR